MTLPKIQLIETENPGYKIRTALNASSNDCTFYVYSAGFSGTEGTKLTKRHSNIFVHCSVDNPVQNAVDMLSKVEFATLNVAGNSIARFNSSWDQQKLNLYVYRVLLEMSETRTIASITSGGQTGGDWAGLVAGIALDIPIIGRFPRGFKRRNREGIDWHSSQSTIEDELTSDVVKVLDEYDSTIEL